jgi:phospholipase C
MPNVHKIAINFRTHNENKDDDTILHVFLKNRSTSTATPEGECDFITNNLAFDRFNDPNYAGINPYLGRAVDALHGTEFKDPSAHEVDLQLRARPIPLSEIELPVVNVHILPNGNDRWIFSYTISFFFDDGSTPLVYSSDVDGVTGIILDQDNRDYSGICADNTRVPPRAPYKLQSNAVLREVTVNFYTHDDNKDHDTVVNLHLVNRLSTTSNQDIAIGLDVLKGTEFKTGSIHGVLFGQNGLPLASNSIMLRDMALPEININIVPNGHDRWIFDWEMHLVFTETQVDGQTVERVYQTRRNGIILDQDNHKYKGVYNGDPLPTATPEPKAKLSPAPINHLGNNAKKISLSYLQRKLDDFINNRQGVGSQYPPIRKVRLHNTGSFGGPEPETYYDLQSIEAYPPPPGVLSPPGFNMATHYVSSPTSLGEIKKFFSFGDLYLNNINSKTLTAQVDGSSPTPLTVEIDFDCSGPNEVIGGSSTSVSEMDLTTFNVALKLTLTPDIRKNSVGQIVTGRIDLMSWVPEINNLKATPLPFGLVRVTGTFLGKPVNTDAASLDAFKASCKDQVIQVTVVTTSTFDPGGFFRQNVRDMIFSKLSDGSGSSTLRDKLNSAANSWFLGGVLNTDIAIDGSANTNGCVLHSVAINGDTLTIEYTGPQMTFAPPVPPTWPPKNFAPGNLANIDHIVLLTMENRSFDHILGYLSLPPDKGGAGRTDVDGLKGDEVNFANGVRCPSFPLKPLDTIFTPDPPHGTEPVARAINDGKMDGFAQSYCDERGIDVAPRIMGYHTAATVPVYDLLARDFAICHRWFASHPGPTFCNRFHELTGRLNIDPDGFWEFDNSSPLRAVFTPTIFDYLKQQGVSCTYFEHFYCFLRFFEGYTFDTQHIASFDDPVFGFVNLARNGALPSVSFIDPHFIELPPDGNCDGPPADIQKGQCLVRRVVEAVVASPKWEKTLLIITYDEHGGFYDHVPPPAAAKVSPESLGTYGVRVPAFIISPWVQAGSVFGHDGIAVGPDQPNATDAPPAGANFTPLHFDHTSILKTISRKFLNQNPPYMSARQAAANDFSTVLGNQLRPGRFRPFIPYNFVYGPSQKRLDVQGAITSPGAILWQYNPNDTIAQQFSFEDASDGHFYIRTHTGSLYLTAQQNGVTQDVKYPTGSATIPGKNPDSQRWALTSNAIVVTQQNLFTVSNAAFPGLVLQSAGGSNNSGVAVVLGPPAQSHGPFTVVNPWQVTSPLINTAILTHP